MKIQAVIFVFLCFSLQVVFASDNISVKGKPLIISGIEVEFVVNSRTFPDEWKTEEINAKAVSLELIEIERSTDMVRKALGKYPPAVLSKNLKKIYVLKSMEFFGVEFGGTNSNDVVYITNDGVENGYTDKYVEGTFHHEFSSILLRNYPEFLRETEWLSVNQLDYGAGGVEAIREGTAGQDYDELLMEAGFLVQYATSDMENDFNVFAENMFCSGESFWTYCDQYARINQKCKLIIEFYRKLSPQFTRQYFVSVSNE